MSNACFYAICDEYDNDQCLRSRITQKDKMKVTQLIQKFLIGSKLYHDHLSPGNVQPACRGSGGEKVGNGESHCIFCP